MQQLLLEGVSVTPIQQVTAVSAAINGGYLYKAYVVKRVLEPETNKEVRRALESVNVTYTGSGKYVKEQSPDAGTRIKEDGKVRILLGN